MIIPRSELNLAPIQLTCPSWKPQNSRTISRNHERAMPDKARMQIKKKWLPEFKSRWLPEIEKLGLDPSNHMSPTFIRGGWKFGIEHQRKLQSVVLRWIADPQNPPGPLGGWDECEESSKKKGWFYRIELQPEGLNKLLQELDSMKLSAESWHDAFEVRVERARSEKAPDRRDRLETAPKIPRKFDATTTIYDRNPDVVAEVLERAKGICEICKTAAPFKRKSDGTPYLEVHHNKRLADGGEDTVENAIALCPNCHREAHYGKHFG